MKTIKAIITTAGTFVIGQEGLDINHEICLGKVISITRYKPLLKKLGVTLSNSDEEQEGKTSPLYLYPTEIIENSFSVLTDKGQMDIPVNEVKAIFYERQ